MEEAVGLVEAPPKKAPKSIAVKQVKEIRMNINPISVNRIFSTLKSLCWIGLSSLLFSGCYSYKNQILFQGLSDTTYAASMVQDKPVIQLGDQLSSMVYGLDEKTTAYFNTTMGGGHGGNRQMMMQGGKGGGLRG